MALAQRHGGVELEQRETVGVGQRRQHAREAVAVGVRLDHREHLRAGGALARLAQIARAARTG